MTEEQILEFWKDNNIFKKSLAKKSPNGEFVFYDGPPFATGTPHYGHIVASIMKDVVPRYWTMKGYHVERKWGWDCHGLPVENIVEKEMKMKSKKDIEEAGVEKFNETCRLKVLKYANDWKKTIERVGRWADMNNAYKTMDLNYMETVWWVFRQLWDKGLIYESYKSMYVCPRCETTLSQSEVAEGYKDVQDVSVVAMFELEDKLPGDMKRTYILSWTTTSWTLPGNVALAMGAEIEYVKVLVGSEQDGFYCILSKDRLQDIMKDTPFKIISNIRAKDLEGKKYKPLFNYFVNAKLDNKEKIYTVQLADFVTVEDGTGVVHIAPAFGEEDMKLGKEKHLPFIQHVTIDGRFTSSVKDWPDRLVKPVVAPKDTDMEVVKYLRKVGLVFGDELFEHSYPYCWRCETPLLNYATSSYFVNVTKLKPKLLKLAEKINWSPAPIKEGRFGKWLFGARDWSISRQRFWASVIPIWKCDGGSKVKTRLPVGRGQKSKAESQKLEVRIPNSSEGCGVLKVFGSIKELEKASGQKITDLHKHTMDRITFKCKCGGIMKRIPDVLDCWFESGSMPYAQMHYPFRDRKKFEAKFPAEFIAEGSDQTRTWFYYLHVIAAALFNKPAYKNVIVNGIVLASDGKKMAKRLKNYPEPDIVMDKYGADALRYYLLSSPVMAAENFNFSEAGVKESYQKVILLLSNVLEFYKMYVGDHKNTKIQKSPFEGSPVPLRGVSLPTGDLLKGDRREAGRHENNNPSDPSVQFGADQLLVTNDTHILDRWILAKLNLLIQEVTVQMDNYDLIRSVRPIQGFINELSTWYIRRSRSRFKGEDEIDKENAIATLREVLLTLSKIMAPFTPFIAEKIYQILSQEIQKSFGMAQDGSKKQFNNLTSRLGSKSSTTQKFKQSVHLADWPKVQEILIDKDLISQMDEVRQIVSLGLEQRAKAGIPVRQPLTKAIISGKSSKGLNSEPSKASNYQLSIINYQSLIKAELNVMNIEWQSSKSELAVKLDARLTPALEAQGIARDLTRQINNLRKQKGLTQGDRISITYETKSQKIKSAIKSEKKKILADTLADKIGEGSIHDGKEVEIKEEKVKIKI